ncbi:Copia protein [Phytophthora rubi]|nr:Copia protein [Phytophthora rubi]
MGPMKPTSMGGARYVVTFIDDFSRFVYVYLLASKAQVFDRFREFKALAETQTGCKLKCVRSDNGGEYTSKRFNRFCALHGIVHQTSAPYSPQQNGLAERMNRTLAEMARAMMHYMEVDRQWWGEAVMTAAHIVNRVPNTARRDKSPFEVLTGMQPVLDYLRVFGAHGYVHLDKSKRTKWDARSHRCIFLGYADGSKAYRVWDCEDQRLVKTRTVILDERAPARYRDVILVHDGDGQQQRQVTVEDDDEFVPSDASTSPDAPATGMEVDETGEQPPSMEVDDAPASESLSDVSLVGGSGPNLLEMSDRVRSSESLTRTLCMGGSEGARDEDQVPTVRDSFVQLPALSSSKLIAAPEPTRSLPSSENRIVFSGGSRPGRGFRDQQTRMLTSSGEFSSENGAIPLLTNEPHMTSQADDGDGEPDPKRPRLDEYEIALAATDVPSSYKEAMASPEAKHWKEAIRQEIRSHVRNHTWDLLRRPHCAKVIGCKWVFAHKFDEKGNIVRYKARLVALGCLQTRGVDYYYTYSPVASSNTVRVFLAVCCSMRLKIRQFDIETVFLNGTLDEDVYMAVPQRVRADGGLVCKLRRSLYGLKQAAAVWFKTIRAAFIDIGFVQCRADPCLFVRTGKNGQSPVYIVLYVDDLLVGCATDAEADEICTALSSRFTVKSLGDARFVLGMEIDYSVEKGELTVKQMQFINRMLERFSHVDANLVRNPAVLGQDLAPDDSHAMHDDERSYRELIGSLLYVANATRPDISAILSTLSQYLDCPREMHWRAALRVLHYLKGTATRGIRFRCSSSNRTGIRAYADANWGGDKKTRRSTSGVLLLLGGGPVVYKSKRQATVALSSAEAEYMALALATQEVLWLRYVLTEMGFSAEGPTTLQKDNKSAIGMATNQGYMPRAKHIDLRAHFVRDHIEAGRIKLEYVPTEQQLADFLTKAVPTPRLAQLCKASGIFDVQVEGE